MQELINLDGFEISFHEKSNRIINIEIDDEIIKSERNKLKFAHDGFLYIFEKNSKSNPNLKF